MLDKLTTTQYWWFSNVLAGVFCLLLIFQWVQTMRQTHPHHKPLDDNKIVEQTLKSSNSVSKQQPIQIPTGIFIQSIRFQNATDVNVTGYVWQTYKEKDMPKLKAIPDFRQGIVFPEAVDSGSNYNESEAYRRPIGEGDERAEVVGWYFEKTLRQSFDYSKYPLDEKNVWIRMWHANFDQNVILVPDLEAYGEAVSPGSLFGIDKDIVLGGWAIQESFFQYVNQVYDTDFGIGEQFGHHDFPELRFTVVINRQVINAVVSDVIPTFVCAFLLFTTLLTVTKKENRADRFGFNLMGTVGACSALFFVIIVAHAQLRREFPGNEVVYVEFFYVLMYFMIAGVVANAYLFSMTRQLKLIQYRDNLIPKVAFWPLTWMVANVVTWWTFSSS